MILRPNRRRLIQGAGALAGASALGLPALAQGQTIRVGYVSPQSGPLAAFSEADAFVVAGFTAAMAERGTLVEVIVKDSQSNPNRASEVAQELILDDEVHLICVASAPETCIPVVGVCEAEGMPCISTLCPWQPWFIGQQAGAASPTDWRRLDFSYHFFWGLEDIIEVFTNTWNRLDTNRSVGGLFPNDGDGNAWGDAVLGLPPALAARNFRLTDPGRYQNLTDDFSAQIAAFQEAEAEIVTGVVIPPDWTTFWTQARQRGYTPKAATIGKAILFPSSIEALGDLGHNLTSEIWWSPSHPHVSSLTGQSSGELASAFTEATGRPWTQPIGFVHALFEVAADVIARMDDPEDYEGTAGVISETSLSTVVGNVDWPGENVMPEVAATNVCKTKLVGGQWRTVGRDAPKLLVVENTTDPDVPLGGEVEPITP